MISNEPTSYPKAPITEAVIALHFDAPLSAKIIERFARLQKKQFPRHESLVKHEFKVSGHSASAHTTPNGLKMTSADQSRVVIVTPPQVAIAHQAPYQGWSALYADAKSQWDALLKAKHGGRVGRVSTRFVNRIDIPLQPANNLALVDYFNVGVSLAGRTATMSLQQFNIGLNLLDQSGRFMHTLQLASVFPSPLIDHSSFLLDIDVFTVVPLHGEFWPAVDELHHLKNRFFEDCITEKTRNLFR